MTIERLEGGGRGRPKVVVNQDWLAAVFSPQRRISISKSAKVLGIHRHTLRKNMRRYGIKKAYTPLTDHQLDLIVHAFTTSHPGAGIRYLIGYLQSRGMRIQRSRLHASLHRVNPLAGVLRRRQAIRRRHYKVLRANAIWHCNGHHKLILWSIVIHGFIDGFCRTVCI